MPRRDGGNVSAAVGIDGPDDQLRVLGAVGQLDACRVLTGFQSQQPEAGLVGKNLHL